MKLIYIDESGNTGTKTDDPHQPHHLLAALVVDETQVRAIEEDVRVLGLKHFGAASRNTDFEFHGYEIHKGKGRYFAGMKLHVRIQVMDDLIEIVKKHGIEIIYAMVDKSRNKAELHPHQLAFLFLVERIEDYLKHRKALGLLIADENRDIEQRLIDDLERFKTLNTGFGYRPTKAEHLIDSIHFVRSNNNHLIQLADIVAFMLLRGMRVKQELTAKFQEQKASLPADAQYVKWAEENAAELQKADLRYIEIIERHVKVSKTFP